MGPNRPILNYIDSKHLFCYIDCLAENEIYKQSKAIDYEKQTGEEIDCLQKKIKELQSDLLEAKEFNAILNHEVDIFKKQSSIVTKLFSKIQDKFDSYKNNLPVSNEALNTFSTLYNDIIYLVEKFNSSRSFSLFSRMNTLMEYTKFIKAKDEIWSNYLTHLGIKDMRDILDICQSATELYTTIDEPCKQYFSLFPKLKGYFNSIIKFLDSLQNEHSDNSTLTQLFESIKLIDKNLLEHIKQHDTEITNIFAIIYSIFFNTSEKSDRTNQNLIGKIADTHNNANEAINTALLKLNISNNNKSDIILLGNDILTHNDSWWIDSIKNNYVSILLIYLNNVLSNRENYYYKYSSLQSSYKNLSIKLCNNPLDISLLAFIVNEIHDDIVLLKIEKYLNKFDDIKFIPYSFPQWAPGWYRYLLFKLGNMPKRLKERIEKCFANTYNYL